jgi:hypothetical protein
VEEEENTTHGSAQRLPGLSTSLHLHLVLDSTIHARWEPDVRNAVPRQILALHTSALTLSFDCPTSESPTLAQHDFLRTSVARNGDAINASRVTIDLGKIATNGAIYLAPTWNAQMPWLRYWEHWWNAEELDESESRVTITCRKITGEDTGSEPLRNCFVGASCNF